MCVNVASKDYSGVGHVECWRCNVEYCDDGEGTPDADEVECNGEEDDKPDSVYGCLGVWIYF